MNRFHVNTTHRKSQASVLCALLGSGCVQTHYAKVPVEIDAGYVTYDADGKESIDFFV